MECIRQIFYAVLCVSVLVNATESSGARYELIHEGTSNIDNGVATVSFIHKKFHQCSLIDTCNYVVWKMKMNEYEAMKMMPSDLEGLTVWKKIAKSKAEAVDISNAGLSEGILEYKPALLSDTEYKSCKEAHTNGITQNGVLKIGGKDTTIMAFCDMTTDGGGWTVIQKRVNGSLSFQQDREKYKYGFGFAYGDYWLGLEHIKHLAKPDTALRIDLRNNKGESGYVEYSKFEIHGDKDDFQIKNIEYFNGETLIEGMSGLRDKHFSISDKCNESNNEGWWHGTCVDDRVNLNGLYPNHGWQAPTFMQWKPWNTAETYVVHSEMKIRKKD